MSLAASAAVALGLIAFAASPAQASQSQCGSNQFCLWVDSGYSGSFYQSTNPSLNVCYNLNNNPGIYNKASSGYNRTSRTIRVYANTSCSGELTFLTSGESDSDFSWPPFTSINDNIASFKQI